MPVYPVLAARGVSMMSNKPVVPPARATGVVTPVVGDDQRCGGERVTSAWRSMMSPAADDLQNTYWSAYDQRLVGGDVVGAK